MNYQRAENLFFDWRDAVLRGDQPILYPVGAGELRRIEIGPGLVTLIGGAPGAGKTALIMQLVIDALRLSPSLRALVCNVEMAPTVLLDRQLARLSGIDLSAIRHRRLEAEHGDRLDHALNTIEALADRLAFLRAPYSLDNIAATADDFHADLIVIDYVQRLLPLGEHGDKRGAVDRTMDYLRQFADCGIALVVVAAVARTKDKSGRSSYAGDGLNLASFRESSELEFGADDAFILVPDKKPGQVVMKHLKSRHGECRDLLLDFDRHTQRFDSSNRFEEWSPEKGKLQAALQSTWQRIPAADDDPYDAFEESA